MGRILKWRYPLTLALAGASVLILGSSWGPLPALGPLLSPFSGIWQNRAYRAFEKENIVIEGLQQEVQVAWDEYGVPHIFAKNAHDLYLAQGYLVARDRLFQMDLHSRPGGGILSELAGEVTREMDRLFIKMGMRQASESDLIKMLKDPETRLALEAYSAGINAYITNLKDEEIPPEYRIIGAYPTKWSPLRTAHFLKTMGYNLSARAYDLFLTQLAQKLGREKTEFLFPDILPFNEDEFIFSKSEFQRTLPQVEVPDQFSNFISKLKTWPFFPQPHANNGSNNFAVSPSKSRTGYSILANDTHLGLSLPPIWYELQLSTPEMNTYGASFPGGPGIVLGFNKTVAWGVTNGTTDVLDWFEVEFRTDDSLEYLVDGKWEIAQKTIEVLNVKNANSENVEVIKTRFGNVIHREGKLGLAMKWKISEDSDALMAFLRLNSVGSFAECESAIKLFKSPSQNFLCADASNIGLWHQGAFPKRFQGQGKYVMDGRRSENDWKSEIEVGNLPQAKNPKKGFLSSANNIAVGADYPFYLGWDYEEPYRARRIRKLLTAQDKFTPEDLIDFQNNIQDGFSESVLPSLISHLALERLNEEQKTLVHQLSKWDHQAKIDSVEMTFFNLWWKEFEDLLFEDDLGAREEGFYPRRRRLSQIFKQKVLWVEWIDRSDTPENETLSEIVTLSFDQTWKELIEQNGPAFSKGWQWGRARPTVLKHIARIPGFGSGEREISGTKYTVKANAGDHGPTWKLVVALGPEVRAWSAISGDNLGHPFSSRFAEPVEAWGKGEMKPVYFLKSFEPSEKEKSYNRTSRLRPVKAE